ncbi:unnamed protein product [Didymodactylos carnosus]|uniref:Uncharacterized protein n=1 Tax=Didymodactylos carnosus TaxID=1234261 RepID=A0A815XYY7_9BILA|nr:unnamed protein product [Didymodactylos carnosus]CAF1563877.1 unnamed protein product [Didymodactylos carnosus]CAF4219809.1 unnamed protein product [Didymodactylos carnosus]CAF4425768.1 unnamed protein product [Didymodactylos carnosus]
MHAPPPSYPARPEALKNTYGYVDALSMSKSAMKRLKKSYERFLYMAAKFSPKNEYNFVHPAYAIDIIWHSHMQEPLKYATDSIRIVGYIMDHAPWPSTDVDKTKQSCLDTNNIWKNEFGCDISTDHLHDAVKDQNHNRYDEYD